MKILYTGGNGKYATELKKYNEGLDITFASKNECNLLSHKSIDEFVNTHSYFDIVISGAYKYPGSSIKGLVETFTIGVNHLYLIQQLEKLPSFFINLTTITDIIDKSYLYRAQKKFMEDLLLRYKNFENKNMKVVNFMPGHIDDENIRKLSAEKFIEFIKNIKDLELSSNHHFMFDKKTNNTTPYA